MVQASQQASFSAEGRTALSVRLPRKIHLRMRERALRQGRRVNDIYQEVLEAALEKRLPGEPYLSAPPPSAVAVTLWLDRDFMARFRETLLRRDLVATNFVLTALFERFGRETLVDD